MSDGKVLTKEIAQQIVNEANEYSRDKLSLGSQYNGLSADAAESLASFTGEKLLLSGITEVSDDVTKELSKFKGTLWLGDVKRLCDAAAKNLASHFGSLVLTGIESLTETTADYLSMNQGRVYLDSIREYPENEAFLRLAERLVDPTGSGCVELPNLSSIPSALFAVLVDCESPLALAGIKTLSNEEACFLASSKAVSLTLDGIEVVSETAAATLSTYPETLRMSGLTQINATKGHLLLLKKLLKSVAGTYDTFELCVDCLSEETAKLLGGASCDTLSFPFLKTMSHKEAKHIYKTKSNILLNGINSLSLNAAKEIAKCKGHLGLNLGLLSAKAAEVIRRHKSFPAEIFMEASLAEEVLESPDEVELYDIQYLEEGAAEVLSKYNDELLTLYSLRFLSSEDATWLSKCRGLVLGLRVIMDEAATALGDSSGEHLQMEQLVELSDNAAESLSGFKGDLIMDLKQLPESAADILRKHPSFAEEEEDD